MNGVDALLIATVVIALGFDFTNGFHDTANAVATSISTRALGPRTAVAMSAAFNLLGALVAIEILHTHVANTIGGLVAPKHGVSLGMIIAALVGAIVWNLITWRLGLPSSSSHALIGALIGMGVVAYGVRRGEVGIGGSGGHRAGRFTTHRTGAGVSVHRPHPRHVPSRPAKSDEPTIPPRADRVRVHSCRSRTGPTTPRRRWA